MNFVEAVISEKSKNSTQSAMMRVSCQVACVISNTLWDGSDTIHITAQWEYRSQKLGMVLPFKCRHLNISEETPSWISLKSYNRCMIMQTPLEKGPMSYHQRKVRMESLLLCFQPPFLHHCCMTHPCQPQTPIVSRIINLNLRDVIRLKYY